MSTSTKGPYTIVSNYHVRETFYGSQLTPVERAEFDYLTDDECAEREFVRYSGNVIDLNDIMGAPDDLRALGFDGFNPDTYFSGLAYRYFDVDGNAYDRGVIIARVAVLG